ncbi:MAG: GNAT family N-acetyltransferase [Chloroflexi bacterium]|nr:GNAT family N-acetyltransferase [Chloroflexota bacterium]
MVSLFARDAGRGRDAPDAIEPLTPASAGRVRIPIGCRFTARTLIEHARRYPGFGFTCDGGRQWAVAGPWRRRDDIAELIEVTPGHRRAALVAAIERSLAARGVHLLLVDGGPYEVDPGLTAELGFSLIERVIEYERPLESVQPRPSGLLVRAYCPADQEAVLAVERESFPWLWWNSEEEWRAYVASPGVSVIVGLWNSEIVGYAGFTRFGGDGHLDRLAVRARDQGRGFGATLLVEALRQLAMLGTRRVRLTTQENNERSRALYERYGFRRTRATYDIVGVWLSHPEGRPS